MAFEIIKKGYRYFEHVYNNGSKAVDISDFEAILESVAQTFNIECLNGANVPQKPVPIADIIVRDESTGGSNETFADVESLRARLVALGYVPYLNENGIPEAPADGQTYGRNNGDWVVVTGGVGSGFSKIVVWDGTSTITVPSGYSGTILNYNNGEIVTYTLAGTNLTITGIAEAGNTLILTTE